MIEDAEKAGKILPGCTIIVPTSGNTGNYQFNLNFGYYLHHLSNDNLTVIDQFNKYVCIVMMVDRPSCIARTHGI